MSARVLTRGLGCHCGNDSFRLGMVDTIEQGKRACCPECSLPLRPLDLVCHCANCGNKFCFACVYEVLTTPDEREAGISERESTKQLHRQN